MRLGVVMTGYGACAAACAGVLAALELRGVEPYAVCGLHAGAWPAALYLAGHDAKGMQAALRQNARMGSRMLPPGGAGAVLRRGKTALCAGRRLEHLLQAQAGQRLLALCARRGMFLCRTAHTSRRVIFSSRAFSQEPGAALSLQASVSFAARAAMTAPPFLEPVQWMGSALLAEGDAACASSALLSMGAQRVIVVEPVLSLRRKMDALDLTGAAMDSMHMQCLTMEAAVLRVPLPADTGALSLGDLERIFEAGYCAAEQELDAVLARLGMARCRVLPFRQTHREKGLS